MVIDPNLASIKYQSMTVLLDTVMEAVRTRNRTDRKYLYAKAAKIRYYLKALDYYPTYIDAEKANQILQCLIVTSGIQDYPVPPATSVPPTPQAIVALVGPEGPQGPRGNDGGATDFAVIANGNVVVDSFPVTSAYAARWDIIVNGTAQRAGTIWATWTEDGANIEFTPMVGTDDVNGATSAVDFTVTFSAGTIRLNAVVTADSWDIRGSRYFIPNQGAGVNAAATPLPSAQIFVGNASSVATARAMTGDITIDNTGVTSIAAGAIINADINASAAIDVSKLASLAHNNAVVLTNGSGKIASTANGTNGQVLTIVAGVPAWSTPSVGGTVTSINASGGSTGMAFTGGPVTTSGTLTLTGTLSYANGGTDQTFYATGDILYASAPNVLAKRPIGTTGQVLTVSSGVPTWVSPSGTGITNVATATYTVLSTDNIVQLNNIAARTVTLPLATAMTVGKIYWIKDAAFTAGTAAITVNVTGADTFEGGSTSVTMNINGVAVGFYSDGVNKWYLI